MTVELKTIGTIHTAFDSPENMPIQGAMDPDSRGTVTFSSDYVEGLKDLDGFSHIILIYHFHESEDVVKDEVLNVQPFLEDKTHGVFATRAPRRPNPIGVTVVELMEIDDNELTVRGIDVLDGPPLLDIKPYLSDVDSPGDTRDGWIDGRMSDEHRSDDRFI